MKKFTMVVLATLLVSISSQAKTWRVNSTSNSDADFSTVQDAIDAASAGDIISIEGGSYEGFNVSKKLNIYGTCYERAPHADIVTPDAPTIITSDITINPGAEGSVISSINLAISNSDFRIKTSDIHITRCKTYTLHFVSKFYDDNTLIRKTTINNILVSNSIIKNQIGHREGASLEKDTLLGTNIVFNNCLVPGVLQLTESFGNYNCFSFSCSFDQCVFTYDAQACNSNFQNCIFSNISYGRNILKSTDNNNVINCLLADSDPSSLISYVAGTNNIFGATDIFDSASAYYELSSTTAAMGAGINGEDLGIYGGTSPFIPGGYLQQPTITKLFMPTQVNGSITIDVEAKVIE